VKRSSAISALLILTLVAGCGGTATGPGASQGHERSRARHADAARSGAAVVRDWADSLRGGDVGRAVALFSLPATVENGTPPLELRTRRQVRGFNLALPCGAKVLRTREHAGYTLAEFALTERRGPGGGHCGSGVGGRAATAFRIRAGHIVEWRRIPDIAVPAPTAPAPDPSPAPDAQPSTAPEV
jgi:hypothetical protein